MTRMTRGVQRRMKGRNNEKLLDSIISFSTLRYDSSKCVTECAVQLHIPHDPMIDNFLSRVLMQPNTTSTNAAYGPYLGLGSA